MNLNHLFDRSFQGRANEIALEFEGEVFTFAQIDTRADRTAAFLTARGLVRGDRLCVYLRIALNSSIFILPASAWA